MQIDIVWKRGRGGSRCFRTPCNMLSEHPLLTQWRLLGDEHVGVDVGVDDVTVSAAPHRPSDAHQAVLLPWALNSQRV